MRFPVSLTDTAVLSKSRPPFLFASTTPAPCSGMAALGGSRHATKTTSTKSDRDKPVKKSLSPPSGTSGYQYVLYHVGKDHIAFCFALWVFDLPGEFCYFLRSVSRRKKKFQKSEKRRRLAGSRRDSIRSIGGKGENHHIPHRKGVRRWKRSPANTVNGASSNVNASWFCSMRR